jgi:hypothetical protein
MACRNHHRRAWLCSGAAVQQEMPTCCRHELVACRPGNRASSSSSSSSSGRRAHASTWMARSWNQLQLLTRSWSRQMAIQDSSASVPEHQLLPCGSCNTWFHEICMYAIAFLNIHWHATKSWQMCQPVHLQPTPVAGHDLVKHRATCSHACLPRAGRGPVCRR